MSWPVLPWRILTTWCGSAPAGTLKAAMQSSIRCRRGGIGATQGQAIAAAGALEDDLEAAFAKFMVTGQAAPVVSMM